MGGADLSQTNASENALTRSATLPHVPNLIDRRAAGGAVRIRHWLLNAQAADYLLHVIAAHASLP